jgi:hypothetical protein
MASRPVNRFIRKSRRRGPTLIQRSRAESSEQKAIFHHVTGAGKSRVKRRFFDLTGEDQDTLKQGLERLVGDKMKRQGA